MSVEVKRRENGVKYVLHSLDFTHITCLRTKRTINRI